MDVRSSLKQKGVAVISASLGGFDSQQQHEEQSIPADFYHFTDENLPPRFNAMHPRLQARMVKMFSWQLVPDYDYYLWVDSSCRLSSPDSIKWFLEQIPWDIPDDPFRVGGTDIAVFKHPHRKTVKEEVDYLKYRLSIRCPYITPRYGNEDLYGQFRAVDPNAQLFASTAFIYHNRYPVQMAMKEWFYHNSRYHTNDQLSLPYVVKDLQVNVIPENYLKIPYLEYTRNKK